MLWLVAKLSRVTQGTDRTLGHWGTPEPVGKKKCAESE